MKKNYLGGFVGYIVHTNGEGYYGELFFGDRSECYAQGKDWKEFTDEMTRTCGVRLPIRKYFVFGKMSDYEQCAYIDAHRKGSCIVTKSDWKNGWRLNNRIDEIFMEYLDERYPTLSAKINA